MKTPRIEDFDPKAIPQLGSPMDDLPTIEKPPQPQVAPTMAYGIRVPTISQPKPVVRIPKISKGVTSDHDKSLREIKTPSHRDTTTPRNHDTVVSRYHDTVFESVRKAVREFGKEAATHRFTLAEKRAIADIVHAYRQRGIRTSENEIARIAINFVVRDHGENGKESVLETIIQKLNE